MGGPHKQITRLVALALVGIAVLAAMAFMLIRAEVAVAVAVAVPAAVDLASVIAGILSFITLVMAEAPYLLGRALVAVAVALRVMEVLAVQMVRGPDMAAVLALPLAVAHPLEQVVPVQSVLSGPVVRVAHLHFRLQT
jgi:hypothetical protein